MRSINMIRALHAGLDIPADVFLQQVDGQCDHKYRSVVLWGTMGLVEDPEEKKHALSIMFDHLESNPDHYRKKTFADAAKLQQ